MLLDCKAVEQFKQYVKVHEVESGEEISMGGLHAAAHPYMHARECSRATKCPHAHCTYITLLNL